MNETKLTIREKLTLILIIMLVKMLKPWQYSHEFDGFWEQMKRVVNGEDLFVVKTETAKEILKNKSLERI